MAAYLLERYAEDERIARAIYARDDYTGVLPHIARRAAQGIADPAAKRRVVEHCLEVLTHHVYGDWGATDMAEEVLQHLVQVYAERPDFPPEWLPEVPW